jgi:uncharacterized protein (TIGR02391 family)
MGRSRGSCEKSWTGHLHPAHRYAFNMELRELTNEEIPELPIDRLAYLVLRDAKSSATWNWRNWMLEVEQGRKLHAGGDASTALAEAWQWLHNHSLVGWNPTQGHAAESVRITRLGEKAIQKGFEFVRGYERLNIDLVPILEKKVRPQYLLGDYEIAAFAAMKEVEIAVRERAPHLSNLLGADLMKQAFRQGGPLADFETEHQSEVEARMFLYAGAIGLFKNPASHRRVDYADPTEASEIVLLADLLLRMLERSDHTADAPASN